MAFPMVHGIPGVIDCSAIVEAILELNALVHAVSLPKHLRERLERLPQEQSAVDLPAEDGGPQYRLGPSTEMLCILATLRALK